MGMKGRVARVSNVAKESEDKLQTEVWVYKEHAAGGHYECE